MLKFNQYLDLLDVNECAIGTDDCHDNATCTNIDGSYHCTCEQAFSGNGRNCTGKFSAKA